MQIISIKTLVGLANIMIYTIGILIFLSFGYQNFNVSHETASTVGIILFSLAALIIVIYQILRTMALHKTSFQITHRHVLFNAIFYVAEYLCAGLILAYVLLARFHVITGSGIRIYFFVAFPIIFLATTIGSVLESIVRVEEKIFLNKKLWQASEEWTKSQKASANQDDAKSITTAAKNKNPFLEPLKGVNKNKPTTKKQVKKNETK